MDARLSRGASAVLAFSDGNKTRLGPATIFGVEGATTLKTSLRLFSGRLAVWVKRANKADFTVRHSAGVAAVRGTVFGMEGTDAGLMIELFEGTLDIVDNFGRAASMSAGQSAQLSKSAGLQDISSLPPGAQPPEEPAVEALLAPKTTALSPAHAVPPEELEEVEAGFPSTTSPMQEKKAGSTDSTVSPSSP